MTDPATLLSLADYQLERDRLRLQRVETEVEELAAATVNAQRAIAASLATRAVIRQALAALQGRWLRAIAGERDETRLHYLLSDTLHDAMRELAARLPAASDALPLVGQRLARGLRPRPILTVSQWADRYRVLASGTNAPGPWRTSLTPYLQAIQDDLSEHSPTRTVVFCKSSGLGASEAMNNWVGYIMHHLQNKDMLLVVPTLEMRDRSLNPRLNKMIAESPALAALTVTAARNKANRGDLLEYGAGARLIKSGANSPDSLRSDHLPYVICDEVDAFPWDVGDEGDPMTLIENRQRTFTRAKTYLISTPTLAGKSRIDLMYQRSDMRRYHVPCPHCGHYQPLVWDQLKYRTAPPPADDPHPIPQVLEAWYLCQECGAEIGEGHKPAMLAAGRWVARRPHITSTHGYHLNALYAPIGLGLNWVQVAQKWCNSQGDSAELKAFTNTYLGEVWAENGDSIDDISLITRREAYVWTDLPIGVITAGVDVQAGRIEATIVGWGSGEEGWIIDHHILAGDTTDEELWQELSATLASYPVNIAAIDSSHNTSTVYDFVRPRRWCRAIKGWGGDNGGGLSRSFIEDPKKALQRLRFRNRKGVMVDHVGVDQGKVLLYARLKLVKPGPGYIHFPAGTVCDEEYFAQLAAEKLVTDFKSFRPKQKWVKTRARNEALDCLVYALAALRLLPGDLEQAVRARQAQRAPRHDPAQAPDLAMPPPAPAARRRGAGFVSGWR